MAIEAQTIATRRFTQADQMLFARLSGDRNPMHMDPLAARRTQAGAQVVHGVHALLWALDQMGAHGVPLAGAATLGVQFNKFLLLERPVTLQLRAVESRRVHAQLVVDEQPAVTLVLKFDTGPSRRAPFTPVSEIESDTMLAPDFEAISRRAGRLLAPATNGDWAAVFPAVAGGLGAPAVNGLGQLSRLVGMVCPGLHSIFARLDVDFVDFSGHAGEHLDYRVGTLDERFRMVRMEVDGFGLRGGVDAFVRWPPVAAPSMAQLAGVVDEGEFAGRRALVVGGSRGLGETSARLLASGGAEVIVTYRRGRAEAQALADEICAARGAGACRVLAFDALLPAAPQLAGVEADDLYWFATPHIFRQKSDRFSPELFDEFERVYVGALAEAVATLPDLRALFYPSSVALDENPAGMAEYCRAKEGGEAFCRELATARPLVEVQVERLPRVLSDQTATIARVNNADPVTTLLPILRRMRRGAEAVLSAVGGDVGGYAS